MAKEKEIRNRIKTVKNIAKVTKTMQMISASRMKRSVRLWQESFPYSEEIARFVSGMGDTGSFSHELTRVPEEIKNVAIIVVAPTKGFVGGLVAKQISVLYKNITDIRSRYPGVSISMISVHKLGIKLAQSLNIQNDLHFAKEIVRPDASNMSAVYASVKERFSSGQYDLVYLNYVKYESPSKQDVVFNLLLPVVFSTTDNRLPTGKNEKNIHTSHNSVNSSIFEPDKKQVLGYLLNEYFEKQLITAILSSNASEHSARMISMKNATDNAMEISGNLTLKYNKSRQAQITQQVVEVASGGIE